ncbi:hypothetical protein PRIPAC_76732 [Pristionchus pacificus]|uniref:Uncharacterized protein n=1 Tax=Pristionchus pacificus TaxID=54126 RepID=A0A2A6CJU6_PRIPA|nr:hypothetical protein PRIPAC_76732 [Pristionchus pacificus]|eukprot:PDM78376.1 hypothetical protein PRIPAC_30955 [Pristionchus pacificus]
MLLSIAQHVKSMMMAALSIGILLVVIVDTLLISLEPRFQGPRFQIHFYGPLFNSRYMQLVPASFVEAILFLIII